MRSIALPLKPDFDEQLWTRAQDLVFTRDRLRDAASEAESVVRLAGVPSGGRILDAPCGPGRHALALAASGYEVTGVDRCQTFIAMARDAATRAGATAVFQVGDMRQPVSAQPFDAVLNLFTSFGYFDDPKDDLAVLTAARSALRPAGVFVLDLTTHEQLTRTAWPRRREGKIASGRFVETDDYDEQSGWLNKTVAFPEVGSEADLKFRRRIYSIPSLRELLHGAGFDGVAVFGALDGRRFDGAADRSVLIAHAATGRERGL